MTFEEILDQAIAMLQRRGRVTYRTLRLQFQLDEEQLEALKEALIDAERLAVDEESRVLVWAGPPASPSAASASPVGTQDNSPEQAPPGEDVPATAAGQVPRLPDAERRQLTVLFCDLVDSTAFSGQLDPEDYREVVRAYQATCAVVIQRFEGHIAQYLGDGLLVYFGYPQAHEDDAQRAIHTGLAAIEAIGALNTRLEQRHGVRLAIRVGIHTGLVVVGEVGEGGRRERLALGEVPNVAARLQGLAAPNTVAISATSYHLVQGYFACHDLGVQRLRGVATPLQVYRVMRESGARGRLDAARPRGLTPLVGRGAEVALLLDRWEQARDGLGQIVLLSGEGGIGKSRLVQVLKDHIATAPHTRLECRCSPYYANSAFYPVIDLWQRVFRFETAESPADKLRMLEHVLTEFRLPLAETVPLLASLLSLPLPGERYPPLELTPQRQKQKTLEALLALLLARAAQEPLLFIVEDLHWVDPSTLEFLTLLLDEGPTARLLTLLTCRPEFHAPWGFRAHLTPLTLTRLPRPQVTQMIVRIAGGKTLPPEVVEQIVAKTDGVPLFVEELTKIVLESGLLQEREERYELPGPLPPLAIPATLHDSLMARLDRLATVRDVAQLGATIGRTFAYELLQAVSPLDEGTLQQGLRQLVEAELVYQRGIPPQATYTFKHALIQDAAYQSLLRSTRQRHHQHIAQVLEARFPALCATQPELLARHFTEAGLHEQAIGYWQKAGQRAIERSAYVEAIRHLTTGLEVLTALPDTPARTQSELTLHLALGAPLIATRGWGAPEVERAYTRARELCRQVGQTPQLFPVLAGLWIFYLVRAELQVTRELAEQLLRMAQRSHDPAHLLRSHQALGSTLLWLGEVAPGHAQLEQGIALSYSPQYRSPAALYGEDPGVTCRVNAAFALWLLGYPAQAGQRSQEALTLAQELAHPFSEAYVLALAAMLAQARREGQAAQERAEATIALCTEQGFPFWLPGGTVLRGWALAAQGQREEGSTQMCQGLAAWRAMGAELWPPYFLALLAEAHGAGGQADEGLRVLAEALALVDRTDERWWEAELYRLKGELLFQQAVSEAPQAETCFSHALAVARRQQAKSLELRAAMSLSRLWQQQGKRDAARELLAPIYGWFTEGFDTADLQEAKALLEALA
jgi:class 3 adenylate cyclase/predicted ATPase